jgi:hypothetical protein
MNIPALSSKTGRERLRQPVPLYLSFRIRFSGEESAFCEAARGAPGLAVFARPGIRKTFRRSNPLFPPRSAMTSTEGNESHAPSEDCSLEDIHSHLHVLIKIGTALAEAQ